MDKFVNATRLIGVIDSAIALPKARGNTKLWCDMAMRYTKLVLEKEISAGGEFHRVVHAHWIEHFEDFGESFFVECSACHSSKNVDESKFCPDCGAVMDEEVK